MKPIILPSCFSENSEVAAEDKCSIPLFRKNNLLTGKYYKTVLLSRSFRGSCYQLVVRTKL